METATLRNIKAGRQERETERRIDRETERQRDTQRGTECETERQGRNVYSSLCL